MLIFESSKKLTAHIKALKANGLTIGFVPTMGALHEGHLSLIKTSKKACKLTVCSIFVNPTQFNDKKDFEKYPNTIENDRKLLIKAGCDILFIPSVIEMYPKGFTNRSRVNFGFLAQTLEGEHRPGHFDGMAQIVYKLLRVVAPHKLFMGLKDYQQQLIVAELIRKKKLATKLVALETKREKDGLAMSSRNVRLDSKSRKVAVELSTALKLIKGKVIKSKTQKGLVEIQEKGLSYLKKFKALEVEYLEIRNAKTLKVPASGREKLVALIAAKIGGVRLIDNMLLN